jgi:serine acetyltransferase
MRSWAGYLRVITLRVAERWGVLPKLMSDRTFRRLLGPADCAMAWRTLGATIDPTAFVGTGVWMRQPDNVAIGAGSKLMLVELDSWAPIVIGSNVLINEAKLLSASHHLDSPVFLGYGLPISVGDYAWLARDVLVLPGVSIGRAAVIGAGAVVTRDVDPSAVVAGNPARDVNRRPAVAFEYVPGQM